VKLSHAEAMRLASSTPLRVVALKSPKGNLLSSEGSEKISKTNKLMVEAEALRVKHDFEAAAAKGKEAVAIRREVLGKAHVLSVSAMGLTRLMSAFSAAPEEEQKRLVDGEEARRAAEKAWDSGDYARTAELAKKAVDLREAVMGAKNPEMIDVDALRLLGAAQTELGRLDDAEKTLTRCLEAIEATYGTMHPQAARALERLGWLRASQGKIEEAIDRLRRSLRLIADAEGECPETARIMDTLATALAYNNDYEEAWSLKLRGLVVREKLLGERAPETAESDSNLAWLYSRTGRNVDAIMLREKALSIFDEKLGLDHAYSKIEFINLVVEYERAGRFTEAARNIEELLAGKRGKLSTIGEVTSWTARLGFDYLAGGRLEEGRQTLAKAMQHCIELHASGKVDAAIDLSLRIADSFYQQRLIDETLKMHERIRVWVEAEKTTQSDVVLNALAQMGQVYIDLGRSNEAVTMLKKVVTEFASRYGEEDLQTAQPLCSLGLAYESLNKLDEAEEAWTKVVKIGEAKFPAGDIHAGYGMRGLGRVYAAQKKFDQAGFIFSEARAIVDKNEQLDPVEAVRLRLDMAAYHIASGDKPTAQKLLQESVERSRKFRDRVKGFHADGLCAQALSKMLDAVESGDATGDASALKSELKGILQKLASAQALNAEEKSRLARIAG
jgi:tetratricopeptide (TPR) repeat protein